MRVLLGGCSQRISGRWPRDTNVPGNRCGDKQLDKRAGWRPKKRQYGAQKQVSNGAERTYDRTSLIRTQSKSGSVLVVAACAHTDALLEESGLTRAGLRLERAADSDQAIARVERGEALDVVLLAPPLADPVRVAQRLHSLDRQGAVVVLAEEAGAGELRHALDVAPFLEGDVSMLVAGHPESLLEALTAAAARTRGRREAADERKKRRETPPPLSARYLGTLLDSVPIGIVTLDQSGLVIGWNKRAGEMLEVPEVEALGSPFARFFQPERERLESLIEGLTTAGLDADGEVFERAGRSFEISGARFAIRN